jgi:hypothetical protein
MPTPPDPTGRPSSAKTAAPGARADSSGPQAPPPKGDELPLPARSGSTGSHNPADGNSDFVLAGSSARRSSHESDIAQFLAHPQAGADNTDDAPTVITRGDAPRPVPLPVVVSAGVPSVAGRRLGHFELIEAVGAGGMAAVLKARDTELGRVVALKILPPEAARDPESVNRFKQEARAAAALDHENIARVYYCGEDQGLHFIAFEFVEGINLRQMIERRGVLPAAECVRYMMQVAAGLNHAAERGVVHRDIKPSNILITPDGRAKIVDMGLARHLGSEAVNGGVTQSGVTLGTFDYISPEQALDPRRADVRSDIYSLGCTFYHALTGRPPVPEGTAARKLRAHQNDRPLDPRELNRAIPDELAAVLARMMAKDPADRYQSPVELIAHLKGLAARLRLGADPVEHDSAVKAVPAETHLLPRPPRFQPMWVLATAAVALAAVAFVVATSSPGPAPGGPAVPAPRPVEPAALIDRGDPTIRPTAAASAPVRTAEELARRLEDPGTAKVLLAPGEFDLTKLAKPVVFRGRSLELVGAPPGSPGGMTRVVVAATPRPNRDRPARDVPGSLSLKAAEAVAVRNVWFELKLDAEVAAGGVEAFGTTRPVGLRVDDAASVDLSDCVFVAAGGKLLDHEPRSVSVARDGGCRLSALRCLFAPSFVGVELPAGSQASFTDSGFAPHAAAVLFAEPPAGDLPRPSEVAAERCSFMLNPGGAAVDTGQPVLVTAADCLFAPVEGAAFRPTFPSSEANRRGVVVRTHAAQADGVRFKVPPGRLNGFYSVDPVGTSRTTIPFEECKAAAPLVEERGRAALKQLPWAEREPVEALASAQPWKAFGLKVEGADVDAALFTKEEVGGAQRWVPLGAAFYTPADNSRRAYPDRVTWGGFSPPRRAAEVRKVWWPTAGENDLAPGVYTELRALLKAARPDEIIYVRHTGELKVEREEIKFATKPSEGELRLTFRPDDGARPVLVVQGGDERDQTLFKLKAGEVTFEGLHFKLRPRNGQAAAAVAVIGGKGCTFRNCAFTLAEEDDSKAAAVHLPDVEKVMAMDPATRPVPKVTFDHCLVRGRGRAVWVEVSRPLTLDVADTLTALDGPVLLAEAGGKANASSSKATFARVTALAGGPVVELRGGKAADAMRPGGLGRFDVDADACLFAAVPYAGRPLVDIDGVDPADWRSVLNWRAVKANRYANFDPSAALAVIKPGTQEGLPKEWTRGQWIDNVGEPPPEAEKRFGEVKFAGSVTGLKDLAAVTPADAAVKMADFADLTGLRVPEVGVEPTELQSRLKALLDEVKPE